MKKIRKYSRIAILLSWQVAVAFSAAQPLGVSRCDSAKQAMVVAAHPEAARVGAKILQQGGNAVDAAVATAFMAGVVEPHASGLGGGGGMLIYLKNDDSLHYIDYYMQTSLHADTAFSREKDLFTPRSICVPGTPAGLLTAHRLYGKLPLQDVLAPAIRIAERGFVVTDKLYTNILDKLEVISLYPETQKLFFKDDFPAAPGDTLRNPQLALVLRRLLEKGEEYFYHGAFAEEAARAIQSRGGYLSKEDFAAYRAVERKPLHINYKGYSVFSAPPPQSGLTLLEILNIFQQAQAQRLQAGGFADNPRMIHLLCSAIKRADADRFYFLGDPSAFNIPADALLSQGYARQRFEDIDIERVKYKNSTEIPVGNPLPFVDQNGTEKNTSLPSRDGTHTTHISVVDPWGNAVSLTQTIGLFFGSGFSSQGVIFNSAMSVFYKKPSPNRIGPARRPVTTISPSLVFKEGTIAAVLGTPGGGRIFNVLAQIIIDLIDFKLSPVQTVEAPRFSIRLRSKALKLENRFPAAILDSLRSMGYKCKTTSERDAYFGGVQLIVWDRQLKQYIGVSDSRRDGGAVGF